jgi:hypothetical protein
VIDNDAGGGGGAWLDDIKTAYGEPRKRRSFEDDPAPAHEITSRVWFPANVNHCVIVKRYAKWWVVTVGSHRRGMPHAEVTFTVEPTDDQMRALLALTGFCQSPKATP